MRIYRVSVFLILLSFILSFENRVFSQDSNLVEHVSSLVYHEASEGFATADDGVKWTISTDGKEFVPYDSVAGIHFIPKGDTFRHVTFKTSDIPYTIDSIVVRASCGSSASANVAVKVADNATVESEKLSVSPKDYAFVLNNMKGDIIVQVRHSAAASQPLYIKSIRVYYSAPPCADIILSDSIKVVKLSDEPFDIKTLIAPNDYTGDLVYSVPCASDVASISSDGIVTPLKEGLAKVKILAPAIDNKFAKTVKVVSLYVDGGKYDNNIKTVRYDFTNPADFGYPTGKRSLIRLGNYFNKGLTRVTLVNQPSSDTRLVNIDSSNKYLALSPFAQLKIDVPDGYIIRKVVVYNTDKNPTYYLYDHEFSDVSYGGRKNLIVQSLLLRAISSISVKYIDIDYRPCLTLVDDEENESRVRELKGVSNNVLVKRSLSKDYWNTLCLPFSVPQDSVASVMGQVEIKEYSSLDDMNMMFSTVTSIEAGKPYLIKPQNDIDYLLFNNVTFDQETPLEISYDNNGNKVSFIGTYGLTTLATDGTDLYVSKTGEIKKPSATGNIIKGMRAIIRLSSPDVYKMLQLTVGGNGTSILPSELKDDKLTGKPVYNLNGQRLHNAYSKDLNLGKGVFVIGGRKVINK